MTIESLCCPATPIERRNAKPSLPSIGEQARSKIVSDFKALSLMQQHEAFPAKTAVYNATKDARRQELEAEIRQLGFTSGEAKKKPPRTAKYVGPNGEIWTGVGALALWLRKLKEAGEDIERYLASS